MKKKWVIGCVLPPIVLVLGIIILIQVRSKPLPKGESGAAADALAREMLTAVKADAWEHTRALKWTFRGTNQHLWDRDRHLARVNWDETEVLIDLHHRHGRVWRSGTELQGKDRDKALEKAWAFWANDSYWLNAFTKVFDEGVTRELISLPEGKRGLLVSHASGGVTPGDAYLWVIGPDGLPTEWRMWVSIIPIKGMAITWEGWQPLSTGAMYAPQHKGSVVSIDLTDVAGAASLPELTGGEDPFARLFQ